MPGIVLHSWLALEVLDRWEPADDPSFPVADPTCRNAFLNGSMGPDMGLFPGSEPLVTALAHHVRSAELTRNLVRLAQSDVERAFAWGWFSHVLADVMLHPLINRGVAGIRGVPGWPGVAAGEDERGHRMVEMGLDAFWCHTRRCGPRHCFRPVFDRASISYLARALEVTYGLAFPDRALLASHVASARYNRVLYFLGRIHGARLAREPVPLGCLHHYLFRYLPARYGSALFFRGSVTFDLTHSLRPAAWLVAEVAGAAGSYSCRFLEGYRSGVATLPDYDLHVGRPEAEVGEYAAAVRAKQELDERLGSGEPEVPNRSGGPSAAPPR